MRACVLARSFIPSHMRPPWCLRARSRQAYPLAIAGCIRQGLREKEKSIQHFMIIRSLTLARHRASPRAHTFSVTRGGLSCSCGRALVRSCRRGLASRSRDALLLPPLLTVPSYTCLLARAAHTTALLSESALRPGKSIVFSDSHARAYAEPVELRPRAGCKFCARSQACWCRCSPSPPCHRPRT